MGLNNASPGEGYAPAYQISSTPWVKTQSITLGQIVEITFPQVTRFITVQNSGNDSSQIAVAFTRNGLKPTNANYFTLTGSASYSGDLRMTSLFLSGQLGGTSQFTVIAGLTYIPSGNLTRITGSLTGFEGVG